MHVVIDARTVRARRTGVGNSTWNQLVGLDQHLRAHPAEAIRITAIRHAPDLANPEFANRWKSLSHLRIVDTDADYESHPAGDWWLRVTLPRLMERMGANVLYSPAFIAPRNGPFARVLMIHDDLPWSQSGSYPLKFRTYMRAMIRSSARAARRILYPSQDARNRCDILLGIPSGKSAVVHHGIERLATMQPSVPREKFILCIASGENRKNQEVLIRALANQREMKLVLIGISNSARVDELKKIQQEQDVEFIPHADESTIRGQLARCAAFGLPTRGEGFGLPVLEAMAAGAPLVLSDIPVLREVAGNAAVYLQPDDVEEWKKKLREVASHNDTVQSRISEGIQRAQQFSMEENARQLLINFERARL